MEVAVGEASEGNKAYLVPWGLKSPFLQLSSLLSGGKQEDVTLSTASVIGRCGLIFSSSLQLWFLK